MFEIINLGQPVPKFNRDESAYKFDGAMPRGLGYRYNTSLGAETSAGSIVHLDGLNFGVAQGSVEIAAGTPGAVTIGAADFVDWQDNFVEFRLPGDLNADLSGKVKVITATSKEFTTTDNLVCSAYISGVVPATNADPGGTVGFSGFDFGPPTKAGEIGSSIYIFWVINCSYTNPFTFANENGLALVTTPFAPDTVTSNLITFDMSRLDNVNVEVFNASGTASAIVPATQLGGSDYFAFLWTGAISPFTAGSSTVANSGVFSQAVTVNVGTGGGGPLTADFSADTTSGSGPLDVTFTYDALGGTGPYTFEIDYDGDSVTDDTFNTPGQVTHTYAVQPGPYNATLKVTDSAAPPATNTSPVIAITVTP
jgi:hypothetical protein